MHKISEVKTDVHLLLDCLKCQIDNPDAMKQAFHTLATIFTTVAPDEIKDFFRDQGGLDFITTLSKNVTNVEVMESALYCLGCAVENNVYSQKELTTVGQFTSIHKILSDGKSTTRLKHAASFLLLTLVSKNSTGQCLAKKTLCLSDLLSLLRTSLPSVNTKDCWFDDAGTTGLELWSSVAATLCMCVNNPQNEENQKVCGFILPYVFSIVHNHEDSVVKPLLSFIRFTVVNNEENQKQVKRCGGLGVLSDKLKNCSSNPDIAIPIISTLDACIADSAYNAEEIGELETVKTIMSLLNDENTTQPHKLQIVLTLVHAVEMSEENKKQVLGESGVLALMKSLNDIESGDDELFKAVKYLLQLCTKENPPDEHRNETNEMLDILKKTEEMHRSNGFVLLNKINQLSDRLKQFEEDSARIRSPLSFMSECMTFEPRSHSDCPNHHSYPVCRESFIPSSTPMKERSFEMMNYVPRSLLTPNNNSHPVQQIKSGTPSKFSTMNNKYLPKTSQGFNEKELLRKPSCLNDLYSGPVDIYQDRNLNSGGRLMGLNYQNPACTALCNQNAYIKEAYLNDVELNQINPTISIGGHLEPSDFNKYLVYDCKNQHFRTSCPVDEKVGVCRRFEMNENCEVYQSRQCDKGRSFIEEDKNSIGDSNSKEVFDYDHQHHAVPQPVHAVKDSKNDVQHVPQSCFSWVDENGSNYHIDKFKEHDYMCSNLGKSALECKEDCPADKHCSRPLNNSKTYIAEVLTNLHESKTECVDKEPKCLVDWNNNVEVPTDCRETLAACRENMDNCRENMNGNKQNVDDSYDSLFLCGEIENCKPQLKTKKYEIKLIPVGGEDQYPATESTQNIETTKKNKKQSTEETKEKQLCNKSKTDMMTYNGNTRHVESKTKYSNGKNVLSNENDPKNSDSDLCNEVEKAFSGKIQNDLTSDKLDLVGKSVSPCRILDKRKKENQIAPCKPQGGDGCTNSGKFKRPVGVPLRYSARRSSVRRAEPYWKQHCFTIYNSDFDDTSSCDEGSVFDQALMLNAKNRLSDFVPLTPVKRYRNYSEKSEYSVKPCSSVSSVCFSPGSDVTHTDSLSSETPPKRKCAGCNGTNLNSRTYNIVLESDAFTCQHHRTIRELERQFIKSLPTTVSTKKPLLQPVPASGNSAGTDVYDFTSESDNGEITPPNRSESLTLTRILQSNGTKERRKRVPFTEVEKQNLLFGVEKFGKSWSLILANLKFHETRTAVDLKDKYRGIQKLSKVTHITRKVSRGKPFSMCEDRRLLRGVKQHGYNWKMILKMFTFSRERSREDLRNRWRTLHKKTE